MVRRTIASPLKTPRQNRIVHTSSSMRRVKKPAEDHATADSATMSQPRYRCRSTALIPATSSNSWLRCDHNACACQDLSGASGSVERGDALRRSHLLFVEALAQAILGLLEPPALRVGQRLAGAVEEGLSDSLRGSPRT